jgi:hypothetical protein
MDRDVEERAMTYLYTVQSTYFVVLYRYFRGSERLYIRPLKDRAAWQITARAEKAYRFTHKEHAIKAIEEYCKKWQDEARNFRVMKITEEQFVLKTSQPLLTEPEKNENEQDYYGGGDLL